MRKLLLASIAVLVLCGTASAGEPSYNYEGNGGSIHSSGRCTKSGDTNNQFVKCTVTCIGTIVKDGTELFVDVATVNDPPVPVLFCGVPKEQNHLVFKTCGVNVDRCAHIKITGLAHWQEIAPEEVSFDAISSVTAMHQ